jgi:hypothetical protein
LAASDALELVKPVKLRLGADMLLLKPSVIGSPTTVITIGILLLTSPNACATGDPEPTMTSGLAATISRASFGSWSIAPSAA